MRGMIAIGFATLLMTPSLSTVVSAESLKASGERAAREFVAAGRFEQEEESSGRKQALLWGGVATLGAGVAMMFASQGSEECMDIFHGGEVIGSECIKEDNVGLGVAGLGAAIAGATLTVIGARQQLQIGPRSVTYRVGF